MRLFVALLPPPEILDEVERALAPYRAAWPGLRWLDRRNWHLTLTFLGEVDDLVTERVTPRLERAAARHTRFELSFAGAGAFPSAARARVLWAGLHGARGDLVRLSEATTAAARRAGAPPDRHRKFNPHLSVARCREPADLRELVEALRPYAGTAWTADAIHLVRSNLGQTVRYETLLSWPLRTTS